MTRARRASRGAGGIEAWSSVDPEEWLGDEADAYTKSTDILDVWFDSGSTFQHVLGQPRRQRACRRPRGRPVPRRPRPAPRLVPQLAADRLRALRPRAPKGLLTHGFVVDGQGRKMSKSVGNVVARRRCPTRWAPRSSACGPLPTDYSGDLGLDDKILARVVDAYRRIPQHAALPAGQHLGLRPRHQAVAASELLEVDRYALARASQLQAEDILAHYERYEFHPVVAKLQVFCSEDLGAFYLDVLKDRLYTTAPNSLARRSAQTALWQITHAMLRWMAPFLSFTAEEAWALVGKSAVSIFTGTYWDFGATDDALLPQVVAHPRDPRRGQQGHRSGAHHGRRRLPRCRPRSTSPSRPTTWPCCGRWATTCALSSSPRRAARGRQRRSSPFRSRPAPTPSASAAGTTAKTWAAIPRPEPLRPLRQQPARRGRKPARWPDGDRGQARRRPRALADDRGHHHPG